MALLDSLFNQEGYDPQSTGLLRLLQMRMAGGMPQGQFPDQGMLPQNAAPTSQMQFPPQQQPQQPSFLQSIGSGINDNSHLLMGLGAGIAQGGIGRGLQLGAQFGLADQASKDRAFKTQAAKQSMLATYQMVLAKTGDHQLAMSAASNPEIAKHWLAQAMPAQPKTFEEAAVRGGLGGQPNAASGVPADPMEQYYKLISGKAAATAEGTKRGEMAATIQPGVSGGDVSIPSPPPGADIKKWYEEQTKLAVAKTAGREGKERAASIVTQDVDRAIDLAERAPLRTTGPGGYYLSFLPGTEANNMNQLLQSIKSNAGFDRLQQMRESSPTGGALGQVSNIELQLLTSSIGSLEQSQSKEQFVDNLRRVKNIYMDIIHGPSSGPQREKLGFQKQDNNDPLGIRY